MSFRKQIATLCLLAVAASAQADAWLDSLQGQQLSLYRLAGTFYMTTHEEAETEQLSALPTRLADYRKALTVTDTASASNRDRAQKMQAIREAWEPLDSLLGSNIQQVIGNEQKKYINNGAFNAFQRATDVSNRLPALETALGQAVGAAPGNDARTAVLMQAAVASEALATQYARAATGYFDDKKGDKGNDGLSAAMRNFEAALEKARAQIDRTNTLQSAPMDRIEARWKFVQPTLAKPAANRPRIVFRYLEEISDNFAKLAAVR